MLELMLVDDVEPFAQMLVAAFPDVSWHLATDEVAAIDIATRTALDGSVLDLRATGEEPGWRVAGRVDAPVLVLVDEWRPSLVVEAQRRGVEISYKTHWEIAVEAFCRRVRESVRFRVRRIGEERGLTARELEVLRWFAGGLDQQAIAASLGIARRTVRAHLASIRMKCRVPSSADLRELARSGPAQPTRSL